MSDEGLSESGQVWPVAKFSFVVDFGFMTMPFQEASGLDAESELIEYRAGDSPAFSTVKMPGLQKYGRVRLKKGVAIKDDKFFEWYKTINMNTVKRAPATIKLLDETGGPAMVWTLSNAWTVKLTGTDLKSDGNEVAVELLELAHEGITIANA